MGLLSRISNSETEQKSASTEFTSKNSFGLLAKALNANNKTFDSFQDWARFNNFEHCGIFNLVHGMMVITHSYGMDSQTIANSVSSKDFWEGTLKSENDIINYTKENQEFYNFLQFFSFDLRNNVTHISFFKNADNSPNSLLLVYKLNSDTPINLSANCKQNLTLENKNIKSDYLTEKTDIEKTFCVRSRILTVEILDSIKSVIKSIQLPEANIKNTVIKCISEQIFDLVFRAFPTPNIVNLVKGSKVKIYYIDKSNLDELLLQTHINLLLNDVLCSPTVKPVLVNNGAPSNSDAVITFLGK